jgi:hypothetical protein
MAAAAGRFISLLRLVGPLESGVDAPGTDALPSVVVVHPTLFHLPNAILILPSAQ